MRPWFPQDYFQASIGSASMAGDYENLRFRPPRSFETQQHGSCRLSRLPPSPLGAAKKAADAGALALSFDVRAFGATGDGKTVDSPAINKAIEAAAAAGGGTVIFPAGNYISLLDPAEEPRRSLSLAGLRHHRRGLAQARRDHRIHGRHLRPRRAEDPPSDAYQDYGHNHWHNSLLWGDGISDFSITGPGLIWGQGLSYGAGPDGLLPARALPASDSGRTDDSTCGTGRGCGAGAATAAQARQAQAEQPHACRSAGGPGGAGGGGGFGAAHAARGNYPTSRPSRPASATRPSR